MESQINETIGRPVQEITLPKHQSTYPYARAKGRVITTNVVGVTFEGRQEIVACLRMGDRVWLEMEPDNPHDHNAIKVSRENGEQIGYLSRHLAASIVSFFQVYGYPVKGKVTLLTGSSWGRYLLGVVITFKLPKQKTTNNNRYNPSLCFLGKRDQ
jgi:hypothetical protein